MGAWWLVLAYLVFGPGDRHRVPALLIRHLMFGLAVGVLYPVKTVAVLDATDGPDVAPALAADALMRRWAGGQRHRNGSAGLAGSAGRIHGVAEHGEKDALLMAGVIMAALAVNLAPWLDRLGG